jgi:hypothetical protein
MAAMFWFAWRKRVGLQERAERKERGMARKVERMRTMAASATDSVQAGAELQYMIPGWC